MTGEGGFDASRDPEDDSEGGTTAIRAPVGLDSLINEDADGTTASRAPIESPPVASPGEERVTSTRRQRKLAAEERLREEAVSAKHLCLHLPFNAYCLDCAAAKLKSQPARRRRGDPVVDRMPDTFGEMVTIDHVILAAPDAGIGGERAGLQGADLGTQSLAFDPIRLVYTSPSPRDT